LLFVILKKVGTPGRRAGCAEDHNPPVN
jgi:hypothetical protein